MNWLARSARCPALFLIGAFGLLSSHAQKWTPPTAEETSMTEQNGAPGADAVILFHEQITDDDSLTTTFHERIKILKLGGESLGRVTLDSILPSNGKYDIVSKFAARTIHSDGSVLKMTAAPTQEVVTGRDGKTIHKIYQLPEPNVGSILEYEYTIQLGEHLEPPTWQLQRKYYVRKAHYAWLPSNRKLTVHPGNEHALSVQSIAYSTILPSGVQVTKRAVQDDRTLFELDASEIPALPQEDMLPPVSSFGYRVRFYYSIGSTSEEFWKQTGKLYSDSWDRYAAPGENIKHLVAGLIAPSDTPEQKLRKLYAAVMPIDNFDVDREQGLKIAADQKYPQSANEVLTMSRGNNDQITLLFVAMVRAAGMMANVMRVSNRDEHIFDPSDLNTAQLDDDIAVVELEGKEMFLDPGTRFCPFGHLSWRHAGVAGLRQTKGGTAIAQTPAESVDANQIQRIADLNIDDQGEATGTLKMTFVGTAGINWRQAAAVDSGAFREKVVKDWEALVPKGVEVEISSIDKLEQIDELLTITATIKGPIGTSEVGRILIPADLFEARANPLFRPEARQEPIYFRRREIRHDAIRINFSSKLQLTSVPEKLTKTLAGVQSYELAAESTPTSVTIRRTYAIGQLVYPVSDYPQLQSYFSGIQTKDREPIIFAIR